MRKQIKGKLYDTDKAKLMAKCDAGELYQKRTGEWFLYADATITPMTYSDAFAWSDAHMDEDAVAALVVSESERSKGKPKRVTIALNPDAYAIIKREAAERGTTFTAVIESMAWKLDAEREERRYPWRNE